MLMIRGHGVLTIGKKEIPFENRVNANFLMAPMNLIDIQGMGGGAYESFGLMEVPCNSFQILSDAYDPDLNKIYNRLAFVAINSFQAVVQKPTKVVLRGGGQFQAAGTARSAGFNVVTGEGPVGGVYPYVNISRRRARLRVSGLASVPFTDGWVYHPSLKAMYRYALDSSNIYKLDFDLSTGEFGNSVELIENAFTPTANTNYRWIVTDGISKLFRYKDNNRNVLLIYDLATETLSELNLSGSSINSGATYDEGDNSIVGNGNLTQYVKIDLGTGQGSVYNFPSGKFEFSNLYLVKSEYMMEDRFIRRPYEWTTDLAACSPTSGQYFTNFLNKTYRFPDDDGWVITGAFDSATTPGSLILTMVKEPDMAMSLLTIPPTEVEIDTPFSIEYTLEVMGG